MALEDNLESEEVLDTDIDEEEFEDVDEGIENDVNEEDLDEEELEEFKASMGDPSEVPEPTNAKAKKRKGDKDVEVAAEVPATTGVKVPKVTAEDLDIAEDVDAIFKGVELDEEHTIKAKTVFEAVMVSQINEKIAESVDLIAEQYDSILEESLGNLTEQLDKYLDYVVEEWMEENKLAVEKGIRTEMTEDFLHGLKHLFDEHYVNIPEEKVDVIEELVAKVEELEADLNEQTNKAIELSTVVEAQEQNEIFANLTEDLSDLQVEKLRTLAEGIESNNSEDFRNKVSMLKEQYFGNDDDVYQTTVDDEKDPTPLEEEAEGPQGVMAVYADAISRSIRK